MPPPGGRTGRQSQPRQPRAREDPWNKVCPSMLASTPASMLNQNNPDLGILNRIGLKTSCFRPRPGFLSVARRRLSRLTLYRAGCRSDPGLPVDAKTGLVNLAVDDMDAPIRSRGQCRIVGYNHHRLAAVGDIAQDAEDLLR